MSSMDVDGVQQPKAKAEKRKIFGVDTRKASAAKELEKYMNPANQFVELTSSRPRRVGVTHRYFFYGPDPIHGPPKDWSPIGTIQSAISSIVSVVAPASQNSVPANAAHNTNISDILLQMREVGVESQTEFDRLTDMVESKLNISGGGLFRAPFGAQKKKSLKRNLKGPRKGNRKDRGRTHKK